MNILKNLKLKTIFIYISVAILCLLILTVVIKLWEADISVPFCYNGDALSMQALVKGMIDNGWYLHNSYVGAPNGLYYYDYPMPDNFHFLFLKIISFFNNDFGTTINLYYLLLFPLTSLSCLIVLRHFKMAWGPSIVGSLLFSFLPFRMFRQQAHLFLSAYYMIPLMVMVILWIWEEPLFFKYDNDTKKFTLNFLDLKTILSVIIILIMASSGVYYAFFSAFLIIIAGISSMFVNKKPQYLYISLILIFILSIGIVVNLAPNIFYHLENGQNPNAAQRAPSESEVYSMKIIHLFLPLAGHNIEVLNKISEKYYKTTLLNNGTEYLGILGCFGFIILLIQLIRLNIKEDNSLLIDKLSKLNIFAVLLGTLGGLGAIFAFVISPQIRGYDRISVFIGFFSFFAVAIFLNSIYLKVAKSKILLSLYTILLIGILCIGIWDQTTGYGYIPDYEKIKSEYNNDAEFVKQIEKSVPQNSMIFQLPYIPFPGIENPAHMKVGEYGLFRGYLHSNNLRWSFGTIKGREGDLWYKHVASKPADDLVKTLSVSGFAGIYIDRNGYEDMGAELENKLSKILNTKPIVSQNSKLVFFDMTNYNREFKSKFTEKDWMLLKEKSLYPMFLTWGKGFYGVEGTQEANWRWCSSKGKLVINNLSNREKKVRIKMDFSTGYNELSNLKVKSELFSEDLKISSKISSFSKETIIKPGRNTIEFFSDAKNVNAPLDPRILNFALYNFKIIELNAVDNQGITINN